MRELEAVPSHLGAGRRFQAAGYDSPVSAVERKVKRAEERALVDLRDLDAEGIRRSFVNLASHELRTPVTSIQGFIAVLLAWWEVLPEEQKLEHLGIVESQARHLSRLVDRLLMLTELDAGLLKPREDELSVCGLVGEALGEIGERRSQATVHCDRDLTLRGDGDLIKEILVSIIDNAFKHGATPVAISAASDGTAIDIRVDDRGGGVSPAIIPYLFDRFRQPDTTRRASGLGLSLAVARELARIHGGDVWHERVSDGASFVVRLPSRPGR